MILLCRASRGLVCSHLGTHQSRGPCAYRFRVHVPPRPARLTTPGLSKIFFLDLGPRRRRRRLVHRVRYWTNFAIVGSKVNTRRNLVLVPRQKTQSHPNLFTFSLQAPSPRRPDPEIAIPSPCHPAISNSARLLDRGTDIVALLPQPSKVAPASCRLSRRHLASARVVRNSQLLELLQKKTIDIVY